MSSVILATASPELATRVRTASGDSVLVLTPEQLPAGPAQVMALANGSGPLRAVLVDAQGGRLDAALGLASRFDAQFPGVSVVLLTDRAGEIGLTALRAGVRDLIEPDATVEEIRWVLHRALEASAMRNGGPPMEEHIGGRVITVASPKGGVGKTTIATNLAVGLAEQSPQGVVLVDLDVQFGDVAAALDLDPEYTLGDVTRGPASSDVMAMKTLLARHETGLHVLCGVRSPVEADGITAEQIGTVIGHLKTEFRYVVIDTAPGMSEQTLAALDHTTDLVLVSSLDVPGLRGLRKELELLDELDLEPSTRHVVINMAERSGGLTVKDVEATIKRKVDVVLPRSKKFGVATNQGVPMVQAGGRDKITKDLKSLVSRFAPISSSGPSRWGGRHRGEDR